MMPQNTHYNRPFFNNGEYTGESANVSRVLDSFHSKNGYDKRLRPGYKGTEIQLYSYSMQLYIDYKIRDKVVVGQRTIVLH